MTHTWLRSHNTLPQSDELVLVALYWPGGKLSGYELCYWRDGEWITEDGGYSWPRIASCARGGPAGLLWTYFESAPESATDIAGRIAA